MAELHVQRKRKSLWWLWLIIILIIAVAVYYWYVNYYQNPGPYTTQFIKETFRVS